MAKFFRKEKLNIKKFKKVLLEVFSHHILGKKTKTCQISIFGLQFAAKNIEGCLRISMSYLVNNQIWLNLLVDDRHHFYIFLSTIAILAPKKKS
jgi:hypothetical protein